MNFRSFNFVRFAATVKNVSKKQINEKQFTVQKFFVEKNCKKQLKKTDAIS